MIFLLASFLVSFFHHTQASELPEFYCFNTIFSNFEAVHKRTPEIEESYKQCLRENPVSNSLINLISYSPEIHAFRLEEKPWKNTKAFFCYKESSWFREETVCLPKLSHVKDLAKVHTAMIALYELQDNILQKAVVPPGTPPYNGKIKQPENNKLFDEIYTGNSSNKP